MKTDVFFAKKDNSLIIAYKNEKDQNVFMQIMRANFAPQIDALMICDKNYGIEDIIQNAYEYSIDTIKSIDIGVKYKHIWKPLMMNNIENELEFSIYDVYRAKRDLGILVQKLQELLLYIEPTDIGIKAFSHKTKELLFLSCSNLECSFKKYNLGKNESTADYVNLLKYIDLTKYKLSLVGYAKPYKCCPFEKWNANEPSKSIVWYDAYNKIKHNNDENFHLATLENCVNAIAANIILFSARYSPRYLYEKDDVYSNLIRSSLDYRIEDSKDFYIPNIEGKRSYNGAFSVPFEFHNGRTVDNIYDIHNILPFSEINI